MQTGTFTERVTSWFEQASQNAKSYHYRAAQVELAQQIAEAIQKKSTLIAEAGTGTGKTLSYLVPAILSKKKVIIATGTKHLQDQVLSNEIPQLKRLTPLVKDVALLKGRANYLCRYRLQQTSLNQDFFTESNLHYLSSIQAQIPQLQQGDIAEIEGVPDEAEIWPLVTSTTENCLGKACDFFNECYLLKARRRAQKADLLIINHHLFFADLAMREEGFGELLPAFDAVIFDEAHQLSEVATQFFGEQVSSRQLQRLLQDSQQATMEYTTPDSSLADLRDRLQQNIEVLHTLFRLLPSKGGREEWHAHPRIEQTIAKCHDLFGKFIQHHEALADAHSIFSRIAERAKIFRKRMRKLSADDANIAIWYQVYKKSFVLHLTPVDVAARLKPIFALPKAWIFTSATLSVEQSTRHFQQQLGIECSHVTLLDSPFSYQKQALLYLPPRMPEPSQSNFITALVAAAIPLIDALKGRTFILVTSYRALDHVYTCLKDKTNQPILCQGTMAKQTLLKQFTALGNAVLIGTSSFWEGVDVKGKPLSCVIIEKLPFSSIADPLVKAKQQLYIAQGKDPFHEFQLPKAIIQLKQGIGRLIRDHRDSGVLMIADPRLLTRQYGKIIWQSLPPIPITRRLAEVKKFMVKLDENTRI